MVYKGGNEEYVLTLLIAFVLATGILFMGNITGYSTFPPAGPLAGECNGSFGGSTFNLTVDNVSMSTTLCSDTYQYNLSGDWNRAIGIEFLQNDIIFDCNGSTIVGNGRGKAFAVSRDNITIKNCRITNFTTVFADDRSLGGYGTGLYIENVTIYGNNNFTLSGNYLNNFTLFNSVINQSATHSATMDAGGGNGHNFTDNVINMSANRNAGDSTYFNNTFYDDFGFYSGSEGSVFTNNSFYSQHGIFSKGILIENNSYYGSVFISAGVTFRENHIYGNVTSVTLQGDNATVVNNIFDDPFVSRTNYFFNQGWDPNWLTNFTFENNTVNCTNVDRCIALVGLGRQNLTFHNNTIYGGGRQYTFFLENVSGYLNLTENNFVNTINNCVYIANSTGEINIIGNDFADVFNTSIMLWNVTGANISYHDINSSGFGILLKQVRSSYITNNNFTYTHYNFEDGNGTAILGNDVNYTIINNNFFGNGENSEIWLTNSSYNNFTSNTLNDTSGGTHILLGGNGNFIAHNLVQYGSSSAMQVVGNDNTLFNNTVFNQPLGIILAGNNFNVTSNNFTNLAVGYGFAAIHFLGGTNSKVRNNILANGDSGVGLASCNNVSVIENHIENMSTNGVLVQSVGNHTLHTNNITQAIGYCVWVNDSSNNLIYNNWLNCTNQTYDNRTNFWNTTKQVGVNILGGVFLGGNYFSNYTGEDNDNDTIGETAYSIGGGSNGDELPLTNNYVELPTSLLNALIGGGSSGGGGRSSDYEENVTEGEVERNEEEEKEEEPAIIPVVIQGAGEVLEEVGRRIASFGWWWLLIAFIALIIVIILYKRRNKKVRFI